jgi:DNA-binding MarR family transcriptional regulator
MAQQALGELCHLDANNLVLVLNELEAAGQAERRRDPTDRRRHIVAITPAGQRALVRAEQGMASIEDEVLGALGADERASLRELLARALEAEDAPAPAG